LGLKYAYITGIQASGKRHIGNYFGAMRPMLSFQEMESYSHYCKLPLTTTSKDANLSKGVDT